MNFIFVLHKNLKCENENSTDISRSGFFGVRPISVAISIKRSLVEKIENIWSYCVKVINFRVRKTGFIFWFYVIWYKYKSGYFFHLNPDFFSTVRKYKIITSWWFWKIKWDKFYKVGPCDFTYMWKLKTKQRNKQSKTETDS